jgi:hypothetical protein
MSFFLQVQEESKFLSFHEGNATKRESKDKFVSAVALFATAHSFFLLVN